MSKPTFNQIKLGSRTHKTALTIPRAFERRIGNIIFRWALIENQLYDIVYKVAGIGSKQGRQVIQKFGPEKILPKIEDLLSIEMKELAASADTIKGWVAAIKKCADERDQLAHGVWLHVAGRDLPCLQLTRGEHFHGIEPDAERRPRKVDPVLLEVTTSLLDTQIHDLEKLLAALPDISKAALQPRPLQPRDGAATRRKDSPRPRA